MAESATVNTVTNKKRAADGKERYSTSVSYKRKESTTTREKDHQYLATREATAAMP